MLEESLGKRPAYGIKKDGSSYNIMVVDDSMFVIKQLSQILQSEQYNIVSVASNGLEAFEKYMAFKPDLVTMDITMPKLNGIESLKKIIEFDKDARVIMISAIGKQELVREALIIGAKNYIVKPLNRADVLERVKNVLY